MTEILVVGGGAGGLSAALTLARARRRVLVVDSGTPRNAPAGEVHGFLTQDGTPPAELLAAGKKEVEHYGGRVLTDEVRAVRPNGTTFEVELAGGTARSRRIVVATGLSDELPDVAHIRQRWGRDVLHCPYCHGWEVRDQPLGVIGWRPEAVHQALLVRQWSADVVLVAEELDDASRARLTARGVRVVPGTVTGLDIGEDRLRGMRLAGGTVVPVAAAFVPPRFVPNHALLTGLGCVLDDNGWARVDSTGRTSVPGVWAVGNVVDPTAQVVTAAAAGTKAAAAINMDLVEEELVERVR